QMVERIADLFSGLTACDLISNAPLFDERCGRLRLVPEDAGFPDLVAAVHKTILTAGIPINPRYPKVSPHITFLRYLRRLHDPTWMLRPFNVSCIKWELSELWLTWGATWFGKRSRVTEQGPLALQPRLQVARLR